MKIDKHQLKYKRTRQSTSHKYPVAAATKWVWTLLGSTSVTPNSSDIGMLTMLMRLHRGDWQSDNLIVLLAPVVVG